MMVLNLVLTNITSSQEGTTHLNKALMNLQLVLFSVLSHQLVCHTRKLFHSHSWICFFALVCFTEWCILLSALCETPGGKECALWPLWEGDSRTGKNVGQSRCHHAAADNANWSPGGHDETTVRNADSASWHHWTTETGLSSGISVKSLTLFCQLTWVFRFSSLFSRLHSRKETSKQQTFQQSFQGIYLQTKNAKKICIDEWKSSPLPLCFKTIFSSCFREKYGPEHHNRGKGDYSGVPGLRLFFKTAG